MILKRRDRCWPDYTFGVIIFFNDYTHSARNSDSIATHYWKLFLAIAPYKTQIKGLAILLAQVNDIAYFRCGRALHFTFITTRACLTDFLFRNFDVHAKVTITTI